MALARKTYLAIDGPDGTRVGYLDLSGVPNASSLYPLTLKICKQCDLGDEHVIQEIGLRPWGS